MAQLKSSVVQGSLRVTDTTYTNDLVVSASKTARYALIAPTSAGAPTWRALTNADVGLGNVENIKLTTWTGSSALTTCSKGTFGDMAIKTKGNGFSDSSNTISVAYGTTANTAIQGNANLVKLNGTNKTAASIADFYAPTSSGTANQILVSAGSGAPTWKATASGAAYATGDNAALTFGTLPVGQGGTGRNTLDANNVLVGNGTSMVNLRAITDTTTITEVTTGTTIPTMNTVYNGLMYSRVIVATVHGDGSQVSLTYTNSRITANHVVLNSVVPGAGADITVVTSAGSAAITCSTGVPEFNMILAVPQAVIT